MDTPKMETSALKKFAQSARKSLLEQVGSKLAFVLKSESSARREYPSVVSELEKAVAAQGEAGLIDQVAYTWFNRFCALRFMDVNGYNRVGVVSPAEGQVQPEILAEAKSGIIDDDQFNACVIDQIRGLLNGSISSPDAQAEAYRLLIVGSCNALYERMPYMFERIQDFTELLMPDDLLSENSILANMREVMTPESCQDVEIIGWLYQFYISEKKQDVFDGLKKNIKITAENIPAATQLFTPHWIVRYLVENSLGRLWMLNRPNSRLTEQMVYYIAPEEPESDFLKASGPEEIRICDPAAGSGHMLTYAFDLLYAIYEEEGYDPNDIPGLILTHNLTGVEIDDRAGALAAFALEMKAAAKLGRRRFLRMEAKPNVCVLQNVSFTDDEMHEVANLVGKDLFTDELRETLGQFEEAKNFGSLIVPKLRDPAETLRVVKARDVGGDMLLNEVRERLVAVLRMAEALSPNYHVVVANPPYAGAKGLNGSLGEYVKELFPDARADLFAAFIERGHALILTHGYNSMVTMESWMFLASFEKMRTKLLSRSTINSMVHMPYLGKGGTSMGINFGTTAFVTRKSCEEEFNGRYCCVRYFETDELGVPLVFPPQNERLSSSSAADFKKIPSNPVVYWASPAAIKCFEQGNNLQSVAPAKLGMRTGDNDKWLRKWHEVSVSASKFDASNRDDAKTSGCAWFPYNKGGDFRRWYGNNETLIFWKDDGFEIKSETLEKYPTLSWDNLGWKITNEGDFFKPSCTWTFISSSSFGVRISPGGAIFDVGGSSAFPSKDDLLKVAGFLCSSVAFNFLKMANPTLNFQVANVNALPWFTPGDRADELVGILFSLSKSDWDAYETSWDFTTLPLLSPDHRPDLENATLERSYASLRAHWQSMTDEMRKLEEENNRIFIDAYGLQDELTPEVPIEEITLTCNPAYRYGVKGTEENRETRLRADTMAEFLSYAVGCIFGRYSLDEPGLILANQGERLEDYLARVPQPSFMPDEDNVVPMIDFDGDWFEDDITERFKQFLRVTFGEEHYGENLAFIENALGKSLQKYFTKDFYNDHVKRYKKRPIYWLFSSPKGTFNALIYMHRYRPDTVSVVLNEYLREFRAKLEARKDSYEQISISASASQKEKTQALKMITKIDKAIDEVNGYERDVLYPLAGQNIEIDLDDGVKHNYPLFGSALKKITGLS
jgi:hypothetical protein